MQRNQAVANVRSDIVFFTDDDTLMHPDCAEAILRIYAADHSKRISGIASANVNERPDISGFERKASGPANAGATPAIEEKGLLARNRDLYRRMIRNSAVMRFLEREVLLMAMNRMFVPYDAHRRRAHDDGNEFEFIEKGTYYVKRHLPGYAMSTRRDLALKEQFNPHLLAYCPCEDLEVSYRWGRYGTNIVSLQSRVYHYEVASSRVTRKQAILLGILNSAFFTQLNTDDRPRHKTAFYILSIRRLFGEFLKDALTGRFTFPQARGVFEGIVKSREIFAKAGKDLTDWYPSLQRDVLRK